ncbi:hypothetical protein [uncultured Maricaulis sp.]|uniref:hypothetical protein n=1 Tax=uncultured Maricaulis sp. TaxID=174710 RepID=UPI0030D9ED27|tara:strand:- start:27799 stop:28809 length:1011 start_codon:yes stop_codon:yes gene_type:complete
MFISILAALALTTALDGDGQDAGMAQPPVLQLDAVEPAQADAVRTAAGDYAAFHGVVADLRSAPIGSGEDLDSAMDRLTAFYVHDRLVRAWIAYTAMIAAQHPEYLDDVRELADYYGAQAAMSGLLYDPTYAISFTHADTAEASVVDALERDSAGIREVSDRYRAAAYDLQATRWAQARAGDRRSRLSALENAGSAPSVPLSNEFLLSLDTGLDGVVPASALYDHPEIARMGAYATPQLTLTVGDAVIDPDRDRIGRILSVAALQAISNDPSQSTELINALLSDPVVERCLTWARLDLQQCVAAGHFKYEDSFCIAEHALLDVSRCLGVSAATGTD